MITYCMESPIKTSVDDWLFGHLGRVSVGYRKGREYEILAYSDSEADHAALYRMAREKGARYINSVKSEGVTAID